MRFRLKLPYGALLKKQVAGGVWFKPHFYDAMRRVPSNIFMPGTKKRELPNVKFEEDELVRSFGVRHPQLARFDLQGDNFTDSVTGKFVALQKTLMKMGATRDEALAVAERWMIDHGHDALAHMAVPEEKLAGVRDETTLDRSIFDGLADVAVEQYNVVHNNLRREMVRNRQNRAVERHPATNPMYEAAKNAAKK